MNATINLENKHFPVLLNELISIISPLYGGTFIDCTFGQGGYSKKILENKNNNVLAIDRDKDTQKFAEELKRKHKDRFQFYNIKFSQLQDLEIKNNDLKGIIFDLGYSLDQIKSSSKGLSFNSKGKLNMRMGINNFSANEVISKMNEKNLVRIFKIFGEEKFSKQIVRKIIEIRKNKVIKTEDLTKIIDDVKKYNKSRINNSTKIFQALRIFVNEEISELMNGLINAFNLIPVGGILAVVTFHSLEDKIVKFFFKNYSENKNSSRYIPHKDESIKFFNLKQKKPIIPNLDELKKNPPSRSAKLRYAIKINNKCEFDEFKKKFKYLTDVENLKFNK